MAFAREPLRYSAPGLRWMVCAPGSLPSAHLCIMRILSTAWFFVMAGLPYLQAQFNDKGTFHASIGVALGAHATTYEQTVVVPLLGIPIVTRSTDGAATFTLPIEAHYGIAKVFSLGLSIEPGVYADSSATRKNGLMLVAVQPRFYIVNKDRFAWTASVYMGTARLGIDDAVGNVSSSARYAGGHFGIGTSVVAAFSDQVGLQLGLRSLTTTMPLRSYEQNGQSLSSDRFKAELSTRGALLQIGLCFRF